MGYEKKGIHGSVILIVDDVETNRVILEEIIKDMDCQPVVAENGIQALEQFQRFHPDLVLTDVSMPEMDGHELCRILKSNVQTRDVPVIFISAFGESEDVVKGFSLGGNDYIVKQERSVKITGVFRFRYRNRLGRLSRKEKMCFMRWPIWQRKIPCTIRSVFGG